MNNNTFIHKYIKTLLHPKDICVDMTIGNGNDTFFLASLSAHVYGFDISPIAIENTKKRCEGFTNITLICDNHIYVDSYLHEKVDLFIFNLGYLPGQKESSITKPEDSLLAFQKAYTLLKENGYLIISFYLKQKGGREEYYQIDRYIQNNHIPVLEKYRQDKMDSPITYIIKKLV